MKGAGCNLLRRDWFALLNIQVHGINQMEHPTDDIKEVISRHPDVFREDISSYTGPLIYLELEEDASLKFCKARLLPVDLQQPMEDELDRLRHHGILSSIQHSNCATPLVLVRKSGGTLRACGDYRSTVNAAAKKASYLLLTTAEGFANLCGGTLFSMLHLHQAYQQLNVDDETAALLIVNTTKGLFKVNRLPYGVSAVPAIFQHMLEVTLAGIPGL
ncbi:uncharacterized protein K02A2.6-like [Rhipicephalus sanguineus]|uniref:uncharacterized protein K02A2.6-like n=1 Tax=Rhipicephalus sanguineus TaxID=34632 RepID=UPI0020C2F861|nr:uncharacterized protein K02A2.6-like [Rhipicephalus sanguineus]